MPADIKINRLTAGGVEEYLGDDTQKAKTLVMDAIRQELGVSHSVHFTDFDIASLGESRKAFVREQQGMFNAVSYSIIDHTYAPDSIFKDKLKNFDYTLGSELSQMAKLTDAQMVLFCSGRNYIWTAGRTALYIFASAMVGQSANAFVPVGNEYLLVSLVDMQTGDVIWFNVVFMPGDMRNKEVVQKVVKKMLKDFPQK